ncbi:MAG: DivIVA domain-containing protein [Ruminococcus sp.]|nr:DivIVA domain-containing protein [Ruminococcus sp.]
MLTIDEIKDISFRRGRGYRGEDVDAFIDEVILTFEQMKKEKAELIRKMDILATRVEQYRADEETVRNALLTSQRIADQSVKEANAKAAAIVSDAEAKAASIQKEANATTAKQKEVYLKLKSDSVELRSELEALYKKHLETINTLPTDAVVAREQEELNRKYPTAPVEESEAVEPEYVQPETAAPAEEDVVDVSQVEDTFEPVSTGTEFVPEDNKFSNLKFGENYDVDDE